MVHFLTIKLVVQLLRQTLKNSALITWPLKRPLALVLKLGHIVGRQGGFFPGGGNVPTHYEILGLREGAEPDRIRAAYIQLMRRVHPDSAPRKKPRSRFSATQANIAYSVLRDRASRAIYDRQLARYRHPAAGLMRIEHVSRYQQVRKRLFDLLILLFLFALPRDQPPLDPSPQIGGRSTLWSPWYGSPAAESSMEGLLVHTQNQDRNRSLATITYSIG